MRATEPHPQPSPTEWNVFLTAAQCFSLSRGFTCVSRSSPRVFSLLISLVDAFSLDPNTGLVRSRRLLQSSERFNLTVVATDQGRPPLWGTADLVITVIDVNDNRPVFVRPTNGTIIHISEVLASLNIKLLEKELSSLLKY